MIESKDLITMNFYKKNKVYYSYRTCLYNLMYLTPIIQKNFDGLCYDWIVHRDEFSKNKIINFIDTKLHQTFDDTIWFDIDDFSKEILATRQSNEKIEHWLVRIIKRAIANSRKTCFINKKLEDERFEERRDRIVIYRSSLSSYSTKDLIDKSDMTYTFNLSKKDYKIFIAYLMKKQNLEKEYAYNLYKQGVKDRFIYITLTTLYMNAAFSFMKSEDVKNYFDNLFYDFLPYLKKFYNKVTE